MSWLAKDGKRVPYTDFPLHTITCAHCANVGNSPVITHITAIYTSERPETYLWRCLGPHGFKMLRDTAGNMLGELAAHRQPNIDDEESDPTAMDPVETMDGGCGYWNGVDYSVTGYLANNTGGTLMTKRFYTDCLAKTGDVAYPQKKGLKVLGPAGVAWDIPNTAGNIKRVYLRPDDLAKNDFKVTWMRYDNDNGDYIRLKFEPQGSDHHKVGYEFAPFKKDNMVKLLPGANSVNLTGLAAGMHYLRFAQFDSDNTQLGDYKYHKIVIYGSGPNNVTNKVLARNRLSAGWTKYKTFNGIPVRKVNMTPDHLIKQKVDPLDDVSDK